MAGRREKALSLPEKGEGQMIRTVAPKVAWVGRARTLTLCLVAVLVAASIGLVLRADPAHAQFFVLYTVNSTADQPDANAGDNSCDVDTSTPGDQCTLRAAILDANANGTSVADSIAFNIPTTDPNCNADTGVCTISPAFSLPRISEPVTIDGYTQPGASANTKAVGNDAVLLIRLDGFGIPNQPDGLFIDDDDCVVRGLSITSFGQGGIFIYSSKNNRVEGNFLGITPAGQARGNGMGLIMEDGRSNTIEGNVISGNGPSSTGTGVFIYGGGTTANEVMGNYIGTTKSGTGDLGNSGDGIFVGFGASGNIIGDNDPRDGLTNAANIIAFNGRVGVVVDGTTTSTGTDNRILYNSIFSNTGLGIDLIGGTENAAGATANDGGTADDSDTGPNGLQNKPALTAAITRSGTTTIRGVLDTKPNTTYRVQFFSQPAGNEGKRSLGQKQVPTDEDGRVTFTFSPVNTVAVGQLITATATGPEGTSEFSAVREVTAS
jgi:CSLREA domain-containing protein